MERKNQAQGSEGPEVPEGLVFKKKNTQKNYLYIYIYI